MQDGLMTGAREEDLGIGAMDFKTEGREEKAIQEAHFMEEGRAMADLATEGIQEGTGGVQNKLTE